MPHSDYKCLNCSVKPIERSESPYCSMACSRQFAKLSAEDAKAAYWGWRRLNRLDTWQADKLIYPLFAGNIAE